MKTSLALDEVLLREAMEATGSKTKRAAVEAGLRLLVSLKKQEGIRQLRGMVEWEGDLRAMRQRREFESSTEK